MYQKTTPSGDTFIVPERGDPDWGANVTAILDRSLDSLQSGDVLISNELVITPVEVVVSPNDILNETGASTLLIRTDGQDLTLNVVTPVTTPTNRDGKILHVICTDEDNVVTIPDSGNTDINGGVTLGFGQAITLQYIAAIGRWIELDRNN